MLFTVPTGTGRATADVYPFYDRSILFREQATASSRSTGIGAMRTEVHVYPTGSRSPPRRHPNQLF